MWVPTAHLNCRNLGVLGAQGSYDTRPCVMGDIAESRGNWGFN